MDSSKLIIKFLKIDTWTSLSCYMDFPKLLHVFSYPQLRMIDLDFEAFLPLAMFVL